MMDDYQTRIFNQDGYTVGTKKNALLLYEWILKRKIDVFLFNGLRRSGPSRLRNVDLLSEAIKPLLTSGLIKRLPEWSCIDGMFSKQSFALEGNDKKYPVRVSTAWQAGRISRHKTGGLPDILSHFHSNAKTARLVGVMPETIKSIKHIRNKTINAPTKQKIDAYLTGLRDQINEYLNNESI